MPSERLVECQDCGYRWESGAENPRCAKSDCGRSRNVEPVADDLDRDDDLDDDQDQPVEDVEETPDEGGDAEPGRGTPSGESDEDTDPDNGSGGYTPAFQTQQTRTDTARERATTTDEDVREAVDDAGQDDGDQDGDQDDDQDGSDQQPSGPDELPEIDPETLKPAIEATFGLAATQRGDHWDVDEDEAMKLAEGWTPVINHYAPHVLRQYTEVGAALIVTYTVLAPRLAEDKRLADLEEKAAEDTDASGSVREPRIEEAGEGIDVEIEDSSETSDPAEAAPVGGYANV